MERLSLVIRLIVFYRVEPDITDTVNWALKPMTFTYPPPGGHAQTMKTLRRNPLGINIKQNAVEGGGGGGGRMLEGGGGRTEDGRGRKG